MPAAAAVHVSRKRPRRGQRHRTPPPVPLDLLLEVAARTDPATVVRFAAACKDLYRHIADGGFHRRLRLRHAGRFVPSLLCGHLVDKWDSKLRMVNTTTAAGASVPLRATTIFPLSSGGGEPSTRRMRPIAARDGLVLVHEIEPLNQLLVCSPAAGRSQALPPSSLRDGQYVLLVGDGVGGIVGRPFQVLRVNTVLTNRCALRFQVFSSERGAWGPYTETSAPLTQRSNGLGQLLGKPLVVGETVHWMYQGDNSHYIFKLHAGKARLTLAKLPASFTLACTTPGKDPPCNGFDIPEPDRACCEQ
ncbi:hypothetical protein ACP70R_020604 [Stipagrostis hirtigluma subsp. patula]